MKLACIVAVMAGCLGAQTDSRGIVPEAVLQARPQHKGAASSPVPALAPRYVPQGSPGGIARVGAKQLGVTIWRLRAATGDDRGARILVQEQTGATTWIPERVSSTTILGAGDRVRLTFESPGQGYLYVIDRERYASGERGMPFLIFPTTRTRGGDNRVAPGRLIDIPGQEDRPNFFTMHKTRADQVEEEITVLLTTKPLDGLEIGLGALALSSEQVAGWEKQWKGKVQIFELSGGAGKAWTAAEQRAAADSTRLLTQEDPAPKTVYRVEAGASEPTLITIRLRYR